VQAYIDFLAQRNRYEQWQLEQINDALRLLFAEYLSLPQAKPWPIRILQTASEEGIVKQVGEAGIFRIGTVWKSERLRQIVVRDAKVVKDRVNKMLYILSKHLSIH